MSELKVDKVSPRSGTYVSLNTVGSKNIVINGDMSIAQRSTSVASITTTGYYTVDRWQNLISSLGTWTNSQSTDVPTGQGFATSLKMDCTTADASPASNDVNLLIQRFEGQNLQYLKKGTANAESLTLSFWVKSNKTGTYTVEIYDVDNTRYIGKTYTISIADTWEKKTLTFAGDTTGALDNDNVDSLNVHFWLGAGSDFTGGTFNNGTWGDSGNNTRVSSSQVNLADNTANEWYITGVQLEAGTSASDFEFLPFDTQLQRCLRYYEKFVDYSVVPAENANNPTTGGANGWIAFDVNNIRTPPISFKCEKRTAPTIVLYRGGNSTAGNMGWFNGSSWQNAGTSVPKITTKGFYGTYNSGGSFTQFNSYLMDFSWTADSEL
jgi:hypothetical protein